MNRQSNDTPSKHYFYKDLSFYIKNAVMFEEMHFRNKVNKINNTTSSDHFSRNKFELIQSASDEMQIPTIDSSSLSYAMMPHNLNFTQKGKPKFFQRQNPSLFNFPECSLKKQPGQGSLKSQLNEQTLYQMGYSGGDYTSGLILGNPEVQIT